MIGIKAFYSRKIRTVVRRSGKAQFWTIYRVSQEECAILREGVPYVKLYRYNPKHLYPKLNGYGDNCKGKVWTSCISAFYTPTAVSRATPP